MASATAGTFLWSNEITITGSRLAGRGSARFAQCFHNHSNPSPFAPNAIDDTH